MRQIISSLASFLLALARFLAYANFLTFVRRHGQRRARLMVAVMSATTVLAWLYNFLRH